MRTIPFSVELETVITPKDCNRLMEEITLLLKGLLDVDKRIFRKVEDKSIYKSRLELYSNLYKETRGKFIKLIKGEKGYYKEPLELEDFLDKFYYSKTIIYDEDDEDDEDEDDFEVLREVTVTLNEKEKQNISKQTYTTEQNLINEFLKELENIMSNERKILRRDDPEVMKTAIHKSLAEFIHKYSEYTDKGTLEKVFHEVRMKATSKSTLKETVKELAGNTPEDEPISTPISSNVELVPLEEEVEKKDESPTPLPFEPKDSLEEKKEEAMSFKGLPKDDQDLIVMDILERLPDSKSAAIKKELISQGWSEIDYDSVYYTYERCKKKLVK